jgi:6-phosphogluconate dehydrogenase
MTICRIQVLPAAAADASSQWTVDGLVLDSDCVCRVYIRADLTTVVRLAKNWRLGMQIGMIGLGRMGASMVTRLLRGQHDCVVHDRQPQGMAALAALGARSATALQDLVRQLDAPRAIWLMVPAAGVDGLLAQLVPLLAPGDTVIDGGNSHYRDDLRRAVALQAAGIHHLDVGTSGGVAGLDRGYCLMVGGDAAAVQRLVPVFSTLAPGVGSAPPTPGRLADAGSAEQGWLHCGPHGAGHFVKMVHNGIEYGLMAAYAEGFNILRHANIGHTAGVVDAETTPLREPELYRYDMRLPEIAELWRRGSVIGSWLLDLTATALAADPALASFEGRVSDSGEGRWTIQAAIDEAVPAPVLSAALYARFGSRGEADFANRLQSAMRHEFGGHLEASASDAQAKR